MVINTPTRFRAAGVAQPVSTIDLLPTFVAMAGGALDTDLDIDGRSLMPRLAGGDDGHDEAIGEYMAEGSRETVVMIRRGRYKFIHAAQDPCLLFDVQDDPRELRKLADAPEYQGDRPISGSPRPGTSRWLRVIPDSLNSLVSELSGS